MKLGLYKIISCVGIFCCLGCNSEGGTKETVIDGNNIQGPRIKKVQTAQIHLIDYIEIIQSNGQIKNEDQYDLSFPISGTLESIRINKGSRTRKGELIATLKERALGNRITQTEINKDQLNVKIEEIQSAITISQNNYNDLNQLYRDSLISQDQLIEAEQILKGFQSQFQAIQMQKAIANQEIEIFQKQLGLNRLYAPASGIVIAVDVQQGEQIAAGQPFAELKSDNNSQIFAFSVTDKEIVKIALRDSALVYLDAYPNHTFHGTVGFIAPKNNNGASFDVEVELALTTVKLFPGLFGSCKIKVGDVYKRLSIPSNALVWADGNDARVLIPENHIARSRKVVIRSILDNEVLIESGLKRGESVILNANGIVVEGDTIEIVHK